MSQSNNHFVINRLKDKAVLQFECWLKDAYIPVKEDLREPIDEALKNSRNTYETLLDEAIAEFQPEISQKAD
jgi:hypothetical protein